MHFLNPEYLDQIKRNREDEEPSKTLVLALKELKSVNEKQAQQILELRGSVQVLESENTHLNSCLKKMSSDYEEYKSIRKNREDKNTKNQVELIKRIEELEFQNQKLTIEVESYRAIADISTSRSHLATRTHIPESPIERPIPNILTNSSITINQPVSKQIEQLELSNQLLTKNILQADLEEASAIRMKMRNNNKQIAKLKSTLSR